MEIAVDEISIAANKPPHSSFFLCRGRVEYPHWDMRLRCDEISDANNGRSQQYFSCSSVEESQHSFYHFRVLGLIQLINWYCMYHSVNYVGELQQGPYLQSYASCHITSSWSFEEFRISASSPAAIIRQRERERERATPPGRKRGEPHHIGTISFHSSGNYYTGENIGGARLHRLE